MQMYGSEVDGKGNERWLLLFVFVFPMTRQYLFAAYPSLNGSLFFLMLLSQLGHNL